MSVTTERQRLQATLVVEEHEGKPVFRILKERGRSGIEISHERCNRHRFGMLWTYVLAAEGGADISIEVAREDMSGRIQVGVLRNVGRSAYEYHVFIGGEDKGTWLYPTFFEPGQRVILTGHETILSLRLEPSFTNQNRDEEEFGPE